MRTEAYGALRSKRIELAETHISSVFLLERDVFKVKKPVDLGFLDFRTLDQRKAACEAEVLQLRRDTDSAQQCHARSSTLRDIGGRCEDERSAWRCVETNEDRAHVAPAGRRVPRTLLDERAAEEFAHAIEGASRALTRTNFAVLGAPGRPLLERTQPFIAAVGMGCATRLPMQTSRRMLVPYDFTGSSTRACDYALEWSAAVGAALYLVHVIEHFDIPLTADEQTALVHAAKKELENAARLMRPHVREVETEVLHGLPWQEIERAAQDRRADLVVMGTHGHRGVARLLLGSVAAKVLQTSSVPVMTVPEYVAASRSAAGTRLASPLTQGGLEEPHIVALSRGAVALAAALVDEMGGTADLWAVEQVVAADGQVLGAIGEDETFVPEGSHVVSGTAREEAMALARARLRSEVSSLKGARPLGDCSDRNVVLVADGLFSAAHVRVAIAALTKLGPRTMVIASPVVAREVALQLEGRINGVVWLDRATVATTCAYRDDALPSDAIAQEVLRGLAGRVA